MKYSEMTVEQHEKQGQKIAKYIANLIDEGQKDGWDISKKDIKALVRVHNFFTPPEKHIQCVSS